MNSFILVVFLSLFLPDAYTGEAKKLELDLSTAVDMAIRHSEDVRINHLNVDRLEHQYSEALSHALPQVSASVGWNTYVKSPVITADFGPPIGRVEAPIKQPYELDMSVTINQPIWTFGKVFTAMEIANRARETEQFSLRATELDVEYNAKVLYNSVLLAQKSLEIAQRSYQNTLENKKILDGILEYGRVSKFENVKMEADLASRKPAVMEARNRLDIAIKNLRRFLGVEQGIEIVLVDKLKDDFIGYDRDILVEKMQLKQPALKALKSNIDTFREIANWRKADYYPSINLFASYQYMGNSNRMFVGTDNMFQSFVVGIGITGPLWDSFQRRSIYRQAMSDVYISEVRYTKAQRDLVLALESAVSSYNTMIRTYETTLEALRLSRNSYELSVESYSTGRITQTQLNDAELLYTRAQLEKTLALYNINNLMAQIEKLSKEGVRL